MKKKNEEFDNRVDRTLGSLDHLQRVPANPYLYSKIEQRLNAVPEKRIWGWSRQPGPALLILLITFNVFTIVQFNRSDISSAEHRNALSEAYGWSQEASTGIYEDFNWE